MLERRGGDNSPVAVAIENIQFNSIQFYLYSAKS